MTITTPQLQKKELEGQTNRKRMGQRQRKRERERIPSLPKATKILPNISRANKGKELL